VTETDFNGGDGGRALRATGYYRLEQTLTGTDQRFHQRTKADFARWHGASGEPAINADLDNWTPTVPNPNRVSGMESQAKRGRDYVDSLSSLLGEPSFLVCVRRAHSNLVATWFHGGRPCVCRDA
jgi:hypothetical protein